MKRKLTIALCVVESWVSEMEVKLHNLVMSQIKIHSQEDMDKLLILIEKFQDKAISKQLVYYYTQKVLIEFIKYKIKPHQEFCKTISQLALACDNTEDELYLLRLERSSLIELQKMYELKAEIDRKILLSEALLGYKQREE